MCYAIAYLIWRDRARSVKRGRGGFQNSENGCCGPLLFNIEGMHNVAL